MLRRNPPATAASSTVGVLPAATSSRAAAMRALRVRCFWRVRPTCSYGIDMLTMVLYCSSWDLNPVNIGKRETWTEPE